MFRGCDGVATSAMVDRVHPSSDATLRDDEPRLIHGEEEEVEGWVGWSNLRKWWRDAMVRWDRQWRSRLRWRRGRAGRLTRLHPASLLPSSHAGPNIAVQYSTVLLSRHGRPVYVVEQRSASEACDGGFRLEHSPHDVWRGACQIRLWMCGCAGEIHVSLHATLEPQLWVTIYHSATTTLLAYLCAGSLSVCYFYAIPTCVTSVQNACRWCGQVGQAPAAGERHQKCAYQNA